MSRTVKLNGQIVASPASITVTVDGTQVFSGAVGDGAELDTPMLLETLTIENADDTVWAEKSVEVAVTAGIIKVGTMPANTGDISGLAVDSPTRELQDDAGYYNPGKNVSPYGDTTERTSILIAGAAPTTLDNQGFDPGPEGAEHWSGWHFEVAAGETFTCTLRVPPLAASLV